MSVWTDVNVSLPKSSACVIHAKRKDGHELKCYYHGDQMRWLTFYTGKKTSHFQDCCTLEFLHDVTHWSK